MPTINSIRIVNAQFNNGRGTYDHFILDPDGHGFVYELANGGGKTVLLLLILQCVYPNSKLEDNKPFKLMFEGGDKNRTTHAIIEWKLDKGVYNYDYMVTGVCAKKKTAYDGSERDDLDRFNYVIFYTRSNEFDIRNIPLCQTYKDGSLKSVMSYSDTLSTLKGLEKNKPQHCEVRIFIKKGEYLAFLKKFGIIESELETIRRINENENKLDTYFKQYDTSKKLFQGLLIPTTSNCLKDKSHIIGTQNAEVNSDNIAESIFQFRNKIASLKEWQNRLDDYRQLWDESTKLEHAINSVIGAYQARDAMIREAATQYKSYELAIKELSQKLTDLNAQITTVTRKCKECKNDIDFNYLKISESKLNHARVELESLDKTRSDVAQLLKNADYELNFARATGKYVQIKERRRKINALQEQLKNTKKSNEELYVALVQSGAVLHSRFVACLAGQQEDYLTLKSARNSKNAERDNTIRLSARLGGKLEDHREEKSLKENKLMDLAKQESDIRKSLSTHAQAPSALFDINEECERTRETITNRTRELEDIENENNQLKSYQSDLKLKSSETFFEKKSVETRIEDISQKLDEYITQLKNIKEICAIYNTKDIDSCDRKIEQDSTSYTREKIFLEDKLARLEKRLMYIDTYGYDIIDDSIEEIKAKLTGSFRNVIHGMEHLSKLPAAERLKALQKIPWLPKAMFVGSNELESIINNPSKLAVYVQDSSVIIASIDLFNPNVISTTGDIFVPHRDADYYISLLSKEKAKATVEKEKASVTNKLDSITKYIEKMKAHTDSITRFRIKYILNHEGGYESELKSQLETFNSKKDELNRILSTFEIQIQDIKGRLDNNASIISELKKTIVALTEKGGLLDTLNRIITDSSEVESRLKQLNSLIPAHENKLMSLDVLKIEQEKELSRTNESIRNLDKALIETRKLVDKFTPYEGRSTDAMGNIGTDELRTKFEATEKTLHEKDVSVEQLTHEISDNESIISDLTKDITDGYKIPWDLIEQEDPQTAPSEEYITSLGTRRDDLASKYDQLDKKCRDSEIKYRVQKSEFDNSVRKFLDISGYVYMFNSDLMDPKEYEKELRILQSKALILERSLSDLSSNVRSTENVKNSAQNEFNLFSQLEGEYGLSKISVSVTSSLKPYREVNRQIGECTNSLGNTRVAFHQTRQQLQKTAMTLNVGVHYSDSFEVKFGDPESLADANQTAKNVREYMDGLRVDIQTAEIELARLEDDETNIVNLITQCNKVYLDYLKGFASASRIKTHDGNTRLMISVNLDQCIYSDEQSVLNVRSFIRKVLENKDATRYAIGEMTIPAKLLECAIDMSSIKVQILKIDIKGYVRQPWDNINASGGQINAIYIMFLAVLFSYIRKIVIDKSALSTSKVLIVDNPFGTTGSIYLWDDIWTILERNNIQLICPTHTISPKIRSFFPKSYLLTNKFSTDNIAKVCVKEANQNRESIKRTKELMHGQLTLTDEYL